MGQMHRFEEDVGFSTFTTASLEYRQAAASLGRKASLEDDIDKVRVFLDLALSWIQLAENEELLASESRSMARAF
ncbi:MAG: hypothetical protein H7312_00025 [Tardiphaga sp.]|jgi:hypothetical protein|nr:hypothetical protein [Tardiphaga sp.]